MNTTINNCISQGYTEEKFSFKRGKFQENQNCYSQYQGIDSKKVIQMLSYIPFLWIIGLVAYRGDEEIDFHLNQGILLNIACFAVDIVAQIISGIAVFVSYRSLYFLPFILLAFKLLMVVYMVIGMINAKNNNYKKLPIIGQFNNFFA